MKKLLLCLNLLLISSAHSNDTQYVKTVLKDRPILLNRLTKKASLVEKKGENYSHTIFDNNGIEKKVETKGEDFNYKELASSLRQFPKRENLLNLYKKLYWELPQRYLRRNLIRPPKFLERGSVRSITKSIFRLTKDFRDIGKYMPKNSPIKMEENICGPHPDGLIRNLKISSFSYEKGNTQVWNVLDTEFSASIAKLAATLKIPMTLSLPVNPSFDKALINGHVQYLGSHEDNRGGHVVTIVALVENKDLPITSPKGPGGGYFVVKNTWGDCWKDAGFIYLPITWVKTYTKSLTLAFKI